MRNTKFLFIATLTLAIAFHSKAQNTEINKKNPSMKVFPKLKAKTLAGRDVEFPKSLTSKYTFLVLAFEDKGEYEKSQKQASIWAGVWKDNLASKGVAFYEVPMMSGKYKWVSFWVDSGMRSGIAKEQHDQVACFYGDKSVYTSVLEIDDLSKAYGFLLNQEGEILFKVYGLPSDTVIKQLEAMIQN
jgi:hypothetical protein